MWATSVQWKGLDVICSNYYYILDIFYLSHSTYIFIIIVKAILRGTNTHEANESFVCISHNTIMLWIKRRTEGVGNSIHFYISNIMAMYFFIYYFNCSEFLTYRPWVKGTTFVPEGDFGSIKMHHLPFWWTRSNMLKRAPYRNTRSK